MNEGYVKSKYIEFYTRKHYEDINNTLYDEKKFDEDYQKNPNHMTPEQIRMVGYDTMRSQLWSRFIDAKYNALRLEELTASIVVTTQLKSQINILFPTMQVKIIEGSIEKYREPKLRLNKVMIGTEENHIIVIPTLDDEDDNYLQVNYCTEYSTSTNYCSDIELMDQVAKLSNFITSGIKPSSLINKMHHKYENQYCLHYNGREMNLYDVEMMQLYHTLAKQMNDKCGTSYPFSQKMIDKMWKHDVFGNIQYVGKFTLISRYNNTSFELESTYFYEDDKTKQPTFECCSTYGGYTKEELILLLDTLMPYATSNYFAEHSKKAMEDKYRSYDRIGVRYAKRPDYFKDLEYVK